jgi:hypothetical protein
VRVSGNAAEAAAALRAKGSSHEGILISSESSMDLDGVSEVFGVTRGAGVAVFIGFEISGVLGLATLDVDDGVALCEAGDKFVETDCRVEAGFGATAGLETTDSGARGELEIVDLVCG